MKKYFVATLILISIVAIIFLVYQNFYSKDKVNPEKSITTITEEVNREAIEIIATDLEIPWSIDFLPDGEILVTERPGRIVKVSNEEKKVIAEIEDVKVFGEGGLMGLVLHPEFQSNNYLYVMYTYENEGNETLNRVVRYKLQNDSLTDRNIIVDQIPGARFHNGGRIKFGPDNYLYITTGDAQNTSLSQDTKSLAGKILKVDENGSPAPDNPFNSEVYSFGHRNPQGISWDSDGRMWQTEHGRSNPTGFDEVNLIEIRNNYGWPEVEGDEKMQGMETPIIHSGFGTWAPGSATIFKDSLFFGGLRPETLYEFRLNQTNPVLIEHFKNEFGRIREVVLGPDNMLYITTSNRDGRGEAAQDDDKIIRIDPEQL